ncbi:uncharacterized protein EV154DRAFT_604482 [Mucor mucedo]|uniref:uncharacterized protein n=1 Tax=Mucor mucedo TaxID=29922 RepID=UPI00221E7AA8|nr:uncharacterized protein EV154DRAFT_604482 [Mucor mucedo]KAI7888851.1 hypothetical protein EV154DRAFT_604482 [Mucor mucedo]
MIQIKGAKCTFSTIHPTQYHYFVHVRQFDLHFPTSYSLMNESNNSFILPLLGMKDSVEQLFVEVENKLKRPTSHPLNINHVILPEPTWFTPPRGDTVLSRIPKSHDFNSDEYFDSNDKHESKNTSYNEADEYGFEEHPFFT